MLPVYRTRPTRPTQASPPPAPSPLFFPPALLPGRGVDHAPGPVWRPAGGTEGLKAGDQRKRQKKLEKKAAKRKEKKHAQVREQSTPISERLAATVSYPILNCLVTGTLETEGMGWVMLSRELPGG